MHVRSIVSFKWFLVILFSIDDSYAHDIYMFRWNFALKVVYENSKRATATSRPDQAHVETSYRKEEIFLLNLQTRMPEQGCGLYSLARGTFYHHQALFGSFQGGHVQKCSLNRIPNILTPLTSVHLTIFNVFRVYENVVANLNPQCDKQIWCRWKCARNILTNV